MKRVLPLALALVCLAAAHGAAADLQATVEFLSAPECAGRSLGTEGSERARTYLVTALENAGVAPWQGTYLHPFTAGERTGVNIVGWFEGTAEAQTAGLVVVGAHYDGQGALPELHPSADDNASGVAAVLAAAADLGSVGPERGVLVVFFDGEEEGLLGSQAFLAAPVVDPAWIRAVVNLDTVGRPVGETLTVFGAASGSRLTEALRGINTISGFDLGFAAQGEGGSDDASFRARGIPAIQLFGSAHADYHRPTDTADKLDFDFLERVGAFTLELVAYLARADTQIDFVPAGAASVTPDASRQTAGKRRVSFGSIPDFQFSGEGVRLTGVMAGSPAEVAGLQAEDILIGFGGIEVTDLTGYSEAMKQFAPGDQVEVVVRRGDATLRFEVTLRARD